MQEDEMDLDVELEQEGEKRREKKKREEETKQCPYLDTINRSLLDFDFEKQCSVTFANLNVYACLVCGKYFQGRGPKSPAFTHSLQSDHHVFINLHTFRAFCLPDGYEIIDAALDDIKYALNPSFSPRDIALLDAPPSSSSSSFSSTLSKPTSTSSSSGNSYTPVRTLDGKSYLPGIVGLNNVKQNDSLNVVLQALFAVKELRDFFLLDKNVVALAQRSSLLKNFGELVRKVWSRGLFKGQTSPQELLQEVDLASKGQFRIGQRNDPLEFLAWFLSSLHRHLVLKDPSRPSANALARSSIVHQCFQGLVRVTTFKKISRINSLYDPDGAERKEGEEDDLHKNEEGEIEGYHKGETKEVPFLYLSLDLPPPPLFKSESEKNIIPQVALMILLSKFDGTQLHHNNATGEKKRYVITRLPKYLVLHVRRFTKNFYFVEKNPTIVNFPIKNLDLKGHCRLEGEAAEGSSRYDLVSNICHQSIDQDSSEAQGVLEEDAQKEGTYRIDVHHRASDKWFSIQDLNLEETHPQMIALSETYVQIYQRQDNPSSSSSSSSSTA